MYNIGCAGNTGVQGEVENNLQNIIATCLKQGLGASYHVTLCTLVLRCIKTICILHKESCYNSIWKLYSRCKAPVICSTQASACACWKRAFSEGKRIIRTRENQEGRKRNRQHGERFFSSWDCSTQRLLQDRITGLFAEIA